MPRAFCPGFLGRKGGDTALHVGSEAAGLLLQLLYVTNVFTPKTKTGGDVIAT